MLRTLCRCSVATTNTMSQSFSFDKVLFFGREGEEALNYYRLTPEEIKSKKVLEVPGGPGTFTAHARSLGAYVTAADPCYALSLPAQQELAMTDLKAFLKEMDKPEATNIVRSVDWWGDMWHTHTATIDRFLTDQEAHPDSYVGAALPRLPFEDDSFDYVLSSHLLFSYSPCEDGGIKQKDGDGDDLDLTWHFHAVATSTSFMHPSSYLPDPDPDPNPKPQTTSPSWTN